MVLDLPLYQLRQLFKAIGIRRHNQLLQDARTPHLDLEQLPAPMKWELESSFGGNLSEKKKQEIFEKLRAGNT